MNSVAIIVGRFQTPEANPSLINFIKSIVDSHDETVIVLGVSKVKSSKANPLNYTMREAMLKMAFAETRLFALNDHPSDDKWSESLDKIVFQNFPEGAITIYGSADGFVNRYKGRFKVSSTGTSMPPPTHVDDGGNLSESVAFRKGVVAGVSDAYPKVFPTVDMALFRKNRSEILMGIKQIDQKWRLLGGFVDPTDNGYEEAVMRELEEEAGITKVATLQFERSFKVDDWRYRNEVDKIITCLFSADHVDGDPIGSDDISEVKWFGLETVETMFKNSETAPEHGPMLTYLLEKYRH